MSSKQKLTLGAKVVTVSWVLAITAVVTAIVSMDRWNPLDGGLNSLTVRVSLLLFALHFSVLWALVRGRSRALAHLFQGAMSGLLLAPCLAGSMVVTYNGAGAQVITVYSRTLDHKQVNHGSESTSYIFQYAAVPGMDDSSAIISVSSGEYERATIGDVYLLTTSAGKLGVPWLVRRQRAPAP